MMAIFLLAFPALFERHLVEGFLNCCSPLQTSEDCDPTSLRNNQKFPYLLLAFQGKVSTYLGVFWIPLRVSCLVLNPYSQNPLIS